MGVISWAIWGLVVGAFARLLKPGRQRIGFWLTILQIILLLILVPFYWPLIGIK